jgi:hypothetical protein
MANFPTYRQFRDEQEKEMHELAMRDAYRVLGEHGVFTLQLSVSRNSEARRQCFATMNAVGHDVAKAAASNWLRCKYGDCDIEFRQNKDEQKITTEDRCYFHAIITNIKGFPVESDEQ